MFVLYTGCDCNYDLCKAQRGGDYQKWKWFDRCLYDAISNLSSVEQGAFDVFSGLGGVKLDSKYVSTGHFVTYTSASWKKEVAKKFIFVKSNKGMMIHIDKDFKDHGIECCDVSWISKFPDECEILFSRSNLERFKCKVVDESSGTQTVILEKN